MASRLYFFFSAIFVSRPHGELISEHYTVTTWIQSRTAIENIQSETRAQVEVGDHAKHEEKMQSETNAQSELGGAGWCGNHDAASDSLLVISSDTYPSCVSACQQSATCNAVRWIVASNVCNLMRSCPQTNTDPNWSHIIVPPARPGWCGSTDAAAVISSSTYPSCINACQQSALCNAVRWIVASNTCDLMSSCPQTNTDSRWSHAILPANTAAASCSGWDCTVEYQTCGPGVPGATSKAYRCCGGRWREGTDQCPAAFCQGWDCAIENQTCGPGVQGATNKAYRCCEGRWTEGTDLCTTTTTTVPPAASCSGWDCTIEHQTCGPGVPGATSKAYRCCEGRWMEGIAPCSKSKPTLPVSNVNNNEDKGGTNLQGLGLFGSFFDWISMLCSSGGQSQTMKEICKYTPKFGLIWHEPGNATTAKTRPRCNVHGCQCHGHPLDPAQTFFWFGVWVPPSPPILTAFKWSGGGICIALRTKSSGQEIQPGTGSLRFQTSLLDVIGNFLGPAKKKALKAALAIVKLVAGGFSTERAFHLNLKGQPPLLVNARRRNNDDTHKEHYTSDKEYFWQCINHAGWAFPSSLDHACKAMTGHVYLNIVVNLKNVLKKKDTKNSATDTSKPFNVADLFAFSMDLTIMVSADQPSSLAGDVVNSLSPVLAYTLFLLFLKISFSIMLVGSATMKLLLKKFSGGLFADWTIKLAAVLLYFRKTNAAGALYFTYSKGEAANDMAMLKGITPNVPAAKAVATSGFKLFSLDKVSDVLKAAGINVPSSMGPTGLQVQIYAILTGCTGDFPNMKCNLNSNTVGFGFKLAMLIGGSNGYTAFLEKPLSNPTLQKSDTLVFCFSDLKETEPFCLDLGILLWLLDIFLDLVNMVLAVAQAMEKAIEAVGKFGEQVAAQFQKLGEGIAKIGGAIGNAAKDAAKATGQAFSTAGRETGKALSNAGKETGKALSNAGKETGKALSNAGKETGKAIVDVGKKIFSGWR